MMNITGSLRDVNLLSVSLRLVLAVLCGGIIGLERETKRRPAGFRTHILICLGASITTLTSQFMFLNMGLFTDVSRMGAQVIAGIGFIGAGTIIITKHRRVKGLTTAAGLWTTAIIGLACGAGYYEAAVGATLIVILAETVFSRLEYYIMNNSREIKLLVEYGRTDALNAIIRLLSDMDVKILNMEITRSMESGSKNSCAILFLQLHRKYSAEELKKDISSIEGVGAYQEL